jgi:hypothetical protein
MSEDVSVFFMFQSKDACRKTIGRRDGGIIRRNFRSPCSFFRAKNGEHPVDVHYSPPAMTRGFARQISNGGNSDRSGPITSGIRPDSFHRGLSPRFSIPFEGVSARRRGTGEDCPP